MDLKQKHKIILSYVDASIDGKIPAKAEYVPGVGKSPDLNAHAWDLANWYLKFSGLGKEEFACEMLHQIKCILIHCKAFK